MVTSRAGIKSKFQINQKVNILENHKVQIHNIGLLHRECDFHMDWHIEKIYLKITRLPCNILVKFTTEGVRSSCVNVEWANPLGINSPCVIRLMVNRPQGKCGCLMQ